MTKVQDILQKIEQQISQTDLHETFGKQWEILEVKDGVATVIWLDNAMYSEIVVFANGTKW